jgi:hypothetical protein
MHADNLARDPSNTVSPELTVGTVRGVIAGRYVVRYGEVEIERAQRASSCLIEPKLGDRVLVVTHADGAHVLAVLSAAEPDATRLAVSGDLELAASGRVTVEGAEGVRVVTPEELEVAADRARFSTVVATVVVDRLAVLGKEMSTRWSKVRSVVDTIETVSQRLVQRSGRVYRFIQESEQVRARYLEWAAEVAVNIKSRNTIMRSSELTKIDGQQIHLG